MIDQASPVPLTAEDLLGRLGPAEWVVCHLTHRVDERVLSHPALRRAPRPRGSATVRARKRMSLVAVEGLLHSFG